MRTEYLRLHRHENPRKLIDTEGDFQMNVSVLSQQLSTGALSRGDYLRDREAIRIKLGLDEDGKCKTEPINIKPKKKTKVMSSVGEIVIDLSPFGLDNTIRMLNCGDTRTIMVCGPNVATAIPDWRLCMANVGSAMDKLQVICEKGRPLVPIPFRVEWNGDPEDQSPACSIDVMKSIPPANPDKRMPSCGKFGIRFPDKGVWRVASVISGDVIDVINDDAAPRAFIVCEVDLNYYMAELAVLRDTIQHALDMPLAERNKLLVRWE